MKLTIKTLKGQIFTVEADLEQTVLDVKEKIKEAKGFAIEGQKLVFKGKNTTNVDTLQTLGVKQADFMVVMVSAPKKVETKPSEKKQQTTTQKEKQSPVQPQKKQQKPAGQNGVGLIDDQQYQNSLNQLISMGFNRQTAVSALRAAYNNLERAVQYCCNGIPTKTTPPSSTGNQGSSSLPVNPPVQGTSSGSLNPSLLLGLVSSPQFAQLRDLVRANPSALPSIVQSIQSSSPQLYQVISQNPQLFEQFLLGDEQEEDQNINQGVQPGTIQITNEQKQIIERLSALGFSQLEAAQAYIACDKNEELAANLLFDRLANGDFDFQPEVQNKTNQGGQNKDKKDEQDDNDNLFS